MSAAPKAAILAVGTELTTGQITNRNAAWLSERLTDLGVEVVLHETIPDDRPLIHGALERCRGLARLLFVTGGLGPTTDDFTRDVVAEWAGKPLRFDEGSWLHIEERLRGFGIPVAESNRQQCYFPEGAKVLHNSRGTANAFALELPGDTTVFVLPGPPGEVAAIWNDHVDGALRGSLPGLRPTRLLTWQCLGKSEAELGELTERALSGSGLATGYRAHRPYVEVKVWCPEDGLEKARPWLEKLEAAIGPWVATRQGEDIVVPLLRELLRSDETEIIDSAFGGALAERLGSRLREAPFAAELGPAVTLATEWVSPEAPAEWVSTMLAQADSESLTLVAAGLTTQGEWAIGLRDGMTLRQETLRPPWRAPEPGPVPSELADRIRRYAVEITLHRWLGWLRGSSQ